MDNNSIDLGKIYGLSGSTCAGGPCEFVGNIVPNTPSLEQIASYNIQLRARESPTPNAEVQRKLDTMNDGIERSTTATFPEHLTQQPISASTENIPPQQISTNMVSTPMSGSSAAGAELSPITEYNQVFPVTGESIQYLNGFMRTQIGRRIELQMLVGSDNLVTKEGYLLGIGANFILINEIGTNDITSCDFYNIKFVRYFY